MYQYPTYIRCVALVLLFVIVGTSSGVALNVHYCQGNVKSLSLFVKAKACSSLEETEPAPNIAKPCEPDGHSEIGQTQCCVDNSFFCKFRTPYQTEKQLTLLITAKPVSEDLKPVINQDVFRGHLRQVELLEPPYFDLDIQTSFQVFRL